MNGIDFDTAFKALTKNPPHPETVPFPWQRELYRRFSEGRFPDSCSIPTGLGKTSVVAVWLIALANGKPVPRRLVYVVNRRTVVDQTTDEVEKYNKNRAAIQLVEPLAISTLRGQFADNRQWSTDPSRPAVICGTVDMIGSRLLFSGYGVGFKSKPLHAGFLGQDVLLVHDESHLEPAFQELLIAIQKEQHSGERSGELPWPKLRVLELSATSRSGGDVLSLSDEDRAEPEVKKRIEAKKAIHLHENKDEKKLAEEIAELALGHRDTGRAVLVFVRRVDDVEKVIKRLPKNSSAQLTGTIRGKEREELVNKPIFNRFKPKAERGDQTVYLVCTSAGEVGVNISADHLVCDLTTFDSMAQRFGRVNRFGDRDDTRIDIVYPKTFDKESDYDWRLRVTLELLGLLDGDGSPLSLARLRQTAAREPFGTEALRKYILTAQEAARDRSGAESDVLLTAYAPPPIILPVTDILFDSWALTTIRGKLPGRPIIEPYLHGVSEWEPPETHVAWRREVQELRLAFKNDDERKQREPIERKRLARFAEDLLEDYPLKPHELLRDNSSRVFDRMKKLKATKDAADTTIWLVSDDGTVVVTTLGELAKGDKEELDYKTVLLPPNAGGLRNGMLASDSSDADDVADELFDANGRQRRLRVWDDDPDFDEKTEHMRPIRRIDRPAGGDDEDADGRSWCWFELPNDGDTDGSRANKKPVSWQVHVDDVVNNTTDMLSRLPLPQDLKQAVMVAAMFHDHGKRRRLFQRMLGNMDPTKLWAKSGKKGSRVAETYRHEFGSLLDVQDVPEFKALDEDQKELVLHLIAVHHGRGRPHFTADEAFDPEPHGKNLEEIAAETPRRFARLQRKYGRWGLAYLESLLRAADYKASGNPSKTEDE